MAEARNAHQMRMEEKQLDAEIDDQRRGLNWGGWLFALMMVCALIAAVATKSVGITTAFLGVAAMGGIARFIAGRNGETRSREKASPPPADD